MIRTPQPNGTIQVVDSAFGGGYDVERHDELGYAGDIETSVSLEEACDRAVSEGQRVGIPVFLNGELYKEAAL